ncbi:hypothetical protein [Salipiger thiooxidans]|uniref:hypothetical protein n=1 Tax=Salipiger thiooxidans TaxID=282683 RepID=UPI001CD5248A|nr:hypothetical protein [Salipiger thiooxidans]MCA0846118.1 hypothetical protein [Salipiger thiooxidans]
MVSAPFPRNAFAVVLPNGQRAKLTPELARWLDLLRTRTDINTAATGAGASAPIGAYADYRGSGLPITVAGYDVAFSGLTFAGYEVPDIDLTFAEYGDRSSSLDFASYAPPDIDLTFAEYS